VCIFIDNRRADLHNQKRTQPNMVMLNIKIENPIFDNTGNQNSAEHMHASAAATAPHTVTS
jgi:hypothetical protein